jgi:glucosamine--fructose-6-phosphate aminotransferase (isomerizing)
MAHLDQEILDQPRVLARLLEHEQTNVERIAARIGRARTLLMVARGSSDNAALYGKYLFGARNGLLVALAAPSLFTLYHRPPRLKGCWVVALSQSGASDDLVQVLVEARRQGAPSLVITNTGSSPLARQADELILLQAGRERSVAATKSYTAELLALAMLSVARDGTETERRALQGIPEAAARVLEAGRGAAVPERYRTLDRLAVIGRGYNYPTAFELSLKLKELAYLAAEASSSADFRHGPIAVVSKGYPVLLIAPSGRTLPDMLALATVLRRRQAELLIVSDNRRMLALARAALPLPVRVPEWLSPLTAILPGQWFARQLAQARGCSLDRPRGLRKVTRTR